MFASTCCKKFISLAILLFNINSVHWYEAHSASGAIDISVSVQSIQIVSVPRVMDDGKVVTGRNLTETAGPGKKAAVWLCVGGDPKSDDNSSRYADDSYRCALTVKSEKAIMVGGIIMPAPAGVTDNRQDPANGSTQVTFEKSGVSNLMIVSVYGGI